MKETHEIHVQPFLFWVFISIYTVYMYIHIYNKACICINHPCVLTEVGAVRGPKEVGASTSQGALRGHTAQDLQAAGGGGGGDSRGSNTAAHCTAQRACGRSVCVCVCVCVW